MSRFRWGRRRNVQDDHFYTTEDGVLTTVHGPTGETEEIDLGGQGGDVTVKAFPELTVAMQSRDASGTVVAFAPPNGE